MLNLRRVIDHAQTGDLLLVEGRSIFGVLIRVLTGQQFSHVALLQWVGDELYVAEMKEMHGFRRMPLDKWVSSQTPTSALYLGVAPTPVRTAPVVVNDGIAYLEEFHYGYASLFTIWLSQILRRTVRAVGSYVCSTAVQHVWENCGVHFERLADPGDYLPLCDYIYPINANTNGRIN